uniref:Cell death abnormality protein 1-like isoform X3 n=1 Tax=Crassostrea virginica TaxID=6565 RepID=A0A8B8BVK3_CRAVI|nr:cell death abnormality protein 1-like isoform X3 [Crassostrea virginica]
MPSFSNMMLLEKQSAPTSTGMLHVGHPASLQSITKETSFPSVFFPLLGGSNQVYMKMTAQASSKYFLFFVVFYAASWSNYFALVKCACIEDVLSFYNGDNACGFKKKYLESTLFNKEERCLLNCTIALSDPTYENMEHGKIYNIDRLKIVFSQTVAFDQKKLCYKFWRNNVNIKVNCGGQERNENCNLNECKLLHSMCNKTTNECVCNKGYLRKSDTCLQASHLGDNCTDTEQCQEVHSFCNAVSGKCKCRAGFIQHNGTCLPASMLGESCKDERQCLEINPNSTCTDETCQCMDGFLNVSNTCKPSSMLGESCKDERQCLEINPNSTCTDETCQCMDGFLNVSNTCKPAVEINERCSDTKQCQELNRHSICNFESNKCECQQGFIHQNDSCLSVRKLGEECKDPKQCSMTTNNSTCNTTSGVCQCAEGYLMILNTCLPGREILDEICENYNQHSESDQQTRIVETVTCRCNSSFSPSRDTINGEIKFVGVGLAGFVFGVCFGVGLFYICMRRQKKSSNSSVKKLEDTEIQMQNVKVSEHVNSRLIVSNKGTAGCSLEDNGIYNHLRENPDELHGQEDVADYDHCPPQATTDDMYSHMTADNDELQDYDGDYGKIN